MALKDASFGSLYLAWTVLFTIVFGTVAFFRAENNLRAIVEMIALATAAAPFAAALFAVPMWVIIRLAS